MPSPKRAISSNVTFSSWEAHTYVCMNAHLRRQNEAILKGLLSLKAPNEVRIGLDWGQRLVRLLILPNPTPESSCNRMGKQRLRGDSEDGSATNLLTMRTPLSLIEGTQIVSGIRKHHNCKISSCGKVRWNSSGRKHALRYNVSGFWKTWEEGVTIRIVDDMITQSK